MNEKEKKLKKLQKRMKEAHQRGDFVRQAHILKEIEELHRVERREDGAPLAQTLMQYPEEERTRAMAKIFECIVVADIDATMVYDTVKYFRERFGQEIPLLSRLIQIARSYDEIIKTIDEVEDELFSFTYMDIVDEAKTKCEALVSNTVSNIMRRVMNADSR